MGNCTKDFSGSLRKRNIQNKKIFICCQINFILDETANIGGALRTEQADVLSLHQGLELLFAMHPAGILTTHGFVVGVYRSPQGGLYLFDSHSRNELGLQVAEGTAVLMQFSDLQQLTDHLLSVYGGSDDHNQVYTVMGLELDLTPSAETEPVCQVDPERARVTLSEDAQAVADSEPHAVGAAATARAQASTLPCNLPEDEGRPLVGVRLSMDDDLHEIPERQADATGQQGEDSLAQDPNVAVSAGYQGLVELRPVGAAPPQRSPPRTPPPQQQHDEVATVQRGM